ncbi:hypothetical protein KAFR_0C02160 [Kazachstania africana CBS 2517]|uniref:Probable endonuclease LCL3 n=1 Tax=Kazachstania africana (strain ATCC 22294 / BCRC 22015 / CBS 2517 / CECT 1963 / NBRC 1671 / NRRL Y-8276) TaxID=1071382 RepID=H2AS59_KAZAF|nr:hypothetical protein KAFR_0C02160 [Kazachstania africana CBS 2517]CCF57209.1 hypothetical protein KAFR_0C02160 [Kazachstania africana CBS 2517]
MVQARSEKPRIDKDVILTSALLSGSLLGAYICFGRYLRQFKSARDIPKYIFRRRWLYGKVTAVGDGDNFHFFHTPGGILGGWGLFRSLPILEKADINFSKNSNISMVRRFFTLRSGKRKKISRYYLNLAIPLKGKRNLPTVSVRLCGIDAPERAHFGNPAQPFSDEALNWLRYQILGKRIWIKPLSIDQYNRCVARAVYWSWLGGWKDVSLEMINEGMAVVYEAKTNAEFDGREKTYRFCEFIAKAQKKGLWSQKKLETPGEFKKRL